MNSVFTLITKNISYVLVLFLMSNQLRAQVDSNHQESEENQSTIDHVVSYQGFFNYKLNDNTSWSLVNTSTNEIIESGESHISNLHMGVPGHYKFYFTEILQHDVSAACEHAHLPEFINVTVTDFKMDFDFSSIQFSNDIVGGNNMDGSKITINVNYTSADNTPTIFKNGVVLSAGVETSIVGHLSENEILLNPGINTLVYNLSGSATSGTRIMLDFFDANDQVQSYYLTTIIQ